MAEENGIKVDSGELLSVLECSVCCSEYTDPMLTKCGHTFCRGCIEECINRNHECPECKRTLSKDDLAKNIQIERIQRQIQELHNKAKNEIVENVLALEGGFGSNKLPLMNIFQANLKDQLVRFERYCDEAKRECEEQKKRIKAKYAGMKNPPPGEESQELLATDKKCQGTIEYLLKIYDRYMKEVLISPEFLPVKLIVYVPAKGTKIDPVFVKPTESLKEIRLAAEQHFKSVGNPVIKWGLDAKYAIHVPFADKPIMANITEEMRLVAEFGIIPGTRIELLGSVTCEADVPKPCITLKFRKEEKKAYDYYSCETCSLNWVCEPCIQQCHKGHVHKEYLRSHVPTWACCYCAKKGCTLPNKNNPLGTGLAMSVPF